MKAQADIIYLIIILFVVVIALFAVDNIWVAFKQNPTYQALSNATPTGQLATKNVTTSINIINNAVVILFIVGAIASIIAAAFADSSMVFVVPTLVILPLEILFAFVFHDVFFSMIQNSAFSSIAVSYPYIISLFQYLPIVSFVLAIIIIIMTFMK